MTYFEELPMALQEIFQNPDVAEIFIQSHDCVFYEDSSGVHLSDAVFANHENLDKVIDRLCAQAGVVLTLDSPYPCFEIDGLRVQIALNAGDYQKKTLSLRKKRLNRPTLDDLCERGWAQAEHIAILRRALNERRNILMVGATSSGKTTSLSAMLSELDPTERVLLIEDTPELVPPNRLSLSLLTRETDLGSLQKLELSDLIRHALRMRPDRLVLGELRSSEAKDFLLALSTGHSGSISSIHAASADEALLRLEMLVQMGAPQWSLTTIRRLLKLSLDLLVTVERTSEGKRQLKSIHRVFSLEPEGFILESLAQQA